MFVLEPLKIYKAKTCVFFFQTYLCSKLIHIQVDKTTSKVDSSTMGLIERKEEDMGLKERC